MLPFLWWCSWLQRWRQQRWPLICLVVRLEIRRLEIARNVLQAIGNTPMVQLQKVVPPGYGRIHVKLESANPTSSMKDRMTLAMIEGAEEDGRLQPGYSVVEYTLRGIAGRLRDYAPNLFVAAIEPSESPVLSGGQSGAHKIEGMGPSFIPSMWDADLVDEIFTVSTEEAMEMARRLAREEAIFAGTSSGANVVIALRLAQRLRPNATIVTLIVDTGLKYLSTELYRSFDET
ncbi:MAG: pyridoxal-phosphate dependent enzyme [Chloroflexi bacterium]|nr:pyridoxal-phosphate dependent enzyme [Chloroflexota bacterium]